MCASRDVVGMGVQVGVWHGSLPTASEPQLLALLIGRPGYFRGYVCSCGTYYGTLYRSHAHVQICRERAKREGFVDFFSIDGRGAKGRTPQNKPLRK